MSKLKLIQSLSVDDWLWVIEAYLRLWPVLLRIKLKQRSWLKNQFIKTDSVKGHVSIDRSRLLRMFEAVRLASRAHFFKAECLPRSIVLSKMLRARGYQASTIIGIAKEDHSLASHAWVEVNGQMIGEPGSVARDFTRLNL